MPETILVADDSRTVCRVVRWVFHGSPYEVVVATTGEEAVRKAVETKPRVALIDYHLPDRSGLDVCAMLRSHDELGGVPVVILAGKFHPFDEQQAKSSGASAVVYKPFKTDQLYEQVVSLVGSTPARPTTDASPPGPSRRPIAPPPPPPSASGGSPAVAPPAPPAPASDSRPSAPPPPPSRPTGSKGFRKVGRVGSTPPPPPTTESAPPPAQAAPAPASPTAQAPPPAQTAPPPAQSAPPSAADDAEQTVPDVDPSQRPAGAPVSESQVRAVVDDLLPAVVKEVLGQLLREQLADKLEGYTRKKVDQFVDNQLPHIARAKIDDFVDGELQELARKAVDEHLANLSEGL